LLVSFSSLEILKEKRNQELIVSDGLWAEVASQNEDPPQQDAFHQPLENPSLDQEYLWDIIIQKDCETG